MMPDGGMRDALITPSEHAPWTITFNGLGMEDALFAGDDLFDAMIELRRSLEDLDCRLLCAGARRDVYPSGMSRSMSAARKAYVFEADKPATERVDIFSSALPNQVGTVDEQRGYNDSWFAALRNKMQ